MKSRLTPSPEARLLDWARLDGPSLRVSAPSESARARNARNPSAIAMSIGLLIRLFNCPSQFVVDLVGTPLPRVTIFGHITQM
jgi:hypothetical protein